MTQLTVFCAVGLLKLATSDDTINVAVEKVINIDRSSRTSQTAIESQQSVSTLSAESVGSRRELVANSCTHRRRDATGLLSRVGVGGVYWALQSAVWRPLHSRIMMRQNEFFLVS